MLHSDEVAQRTEMAGKVSMLEERSLNLQNKLNRIETDLRCHCTDSEIFLADLNHSLRQTTALIQDKITESVQPLRDDILRYKTVVTVVGTIISSIGVTIGFFADHVMTFIQLIK